MKLIFLVVVLLLLLFLYSACVVSGKCSEMEEKYSNNETNYWSYSSPIKKNLIKKGGARMLEVKCYLPRDIYDNVEKRCNSLNVTKSEYLRLLATLDVYSQNYQQFLSYFNLLDKNIKDIQVKLGMIASSDKMM